MLCRLTFKIWFNRILIHSSKIKAVQILETQNNLWILIMYPIIATSPLKTLTSLMSISSLCKRTKIWIIYTILLSLIRPWEMSEWNFNRWVWIKWASTWLKIKTNSLLYNLQQSYISPQTISRLFTSSRMNLKAGIWYTAIISRPQVAMALMSRCRRLACFSNRTALTLINQTLWKLLIQASSLRCLIIKARTGPEAETTLTGHKNCKHMKWLICKIRMP